MSTVISFDGKICPQERGQATNGQGFSFFEFFAGGGMARLGLGSGWECLFSNDFDEKKASSYRGHFGGKEMVVEDVGKITPNQLPGTPNLIWASFPCQDLSSAGKGQGLEGQRSGTFWPFWNLVKGLKAEGREPDLIVLENVTGAITSNKGRDFSILSETVAELGYYFGAVVIDAVHFVPQSRPRLFYIAVSPRIQIPQELVRSDPSALWHPRSLVNAKFSLNHIAQDSWIWWNLPSPAPRVETLSDIIEDPPTGVRWNTAETTKSLLSMMSPVNIAKVKEAQKSSILKVGTLYKRTRNGMCRAEVRFDDVAGCLRTPTGGSSRQTLILVKGRTVRTRLLSPRESARLMGIPEDYALPTSYNEAYHLSGDGVAVPVVDFLKTSILHPILLANRRKTVQTGA